MKTFDFPLGSPAAPAKNFCVLVPFSEFVRTERTLFRAATIVTALSALAVICRVLKIDLTYDSSSTSATLTMNGVVTLIVLLLASSLALLLPRMCVAWWNNRTPPLLEKTVALICLAVVPFGLVAYYWFVYRRMDPDGQFRLS